jgi:hypothetical protein
MSRPTLDSHGSWSISMTFNRHVPEEVIGEGWRLELQHRWDTETKAYEMEQRVLKALRTPTSVFERVCCTRRQLESVWGASLVSDTRRQSAS